MKIKYRSVFEGIQIVHYIFADVGALQNALVAEVFLDIVVMGEGRTERDKASRREKGARVNCAESCIATLLSATASRSPSTRRKSAGIQRR